MTGHPIVVDASVVVKRVILEEHSEHAYALLDRMWHDGDRVVGPPLLRIEATNAVYQRFRRGDLDADEVDAAIAKVLALNVELLSPPDLIALGYAFARQHQLKNIYDCLYVVLARELATELWTANRRLYNAMAVVAPWVRWVGDYPIP
jgi:predicted nucleic acid-binding protein